MKGICGLRRRRGSTLVEVLVSVAVFSLTLVAVLGVYAGAARAKVRQKEYLYFESVCLDIDAYYDAYGKDAWNTAYFGNDRFEQYYKEDFSFSEEKGKYTLIFRYEENSLFVSVKNDETGRYVIENLNYGRSKNA